MSGKKDGQYIIDLINSYLGLIGKREFTFDWLLGDSSPGKLGKKLRVDVYYSELKLVVEYNEKQHSESVPFFDKPEKLTISGVPRDKQRKIYDQRRKDEIPKHGLKLEIVDYSEFELMPSKRKCLKRTDQDQSVIANKFKAYKRTLLRLRNEPPS